MNVLAVFHGRDGNRIVPPESEVIGQILLSSVLE